MKQLKFTLALLAGLALAGFTTNAFAEDAAAKETTITGNMVCGKCTLHETEKCQNVVQVMEDGKTVNYYLKQNAVSKKEHAAVCHGDTEKVTVTGSVSEKDGKKIVTASKIEVQK
jgi:Family of unknown function (DUF6370)